MFVFVFVYTANSRGSAFLSNSSLRYLTINGARAQTLNLFSIAPQGLTWPQGWGVRNDVFEYERRYYEHSNGLSRVQSHNRIIQTGVEGPQLDCSDWLIGLLLVRQEATYKATKDVKGGNECDDGKCDSEN